MDKKAFLEELERSLSVLQEDEIRDMISEYDQHIDMKVQSGQTEEQVIADFGSISELTADILEAYHVRADYALEKKEKKFSFAESEKAGQEILQQTGEMCRKTGNGLVRLARRIGGWIADAAGACTRWIGRTSAWVKLRAEKCISSVKFRKRQISGEKRENGVQTEGPETFGNGRKRGTVSLIGRCAGIIAGAVRFCLRLLRWGIRLCWNVCWGGIALCCAVCGLICMFGLGMLAVLWMQHYPLAGVTIGCLGLVLCFFSAAGYAATLILRPEKRRQEKKSMSNGRPSGHEQQSKELMNQPMNQKQENRNDESAEWRLLEVSAVSCMGRGDGRHA